MAKIVASKLRTLLIMELLLQKSDENNRLSLIDINQFLEEHEIYADRKSIYSDIATLTEWGMDIGYIKEKPAGWYLISREFELPELKLLVDAVQASKFITKKKSQSLIKKLETLTSENQAKELQRDVYVANRLKAENEQIFYNVNNIHEAIHQNSQIEFTYYQWNLDKQLVPKRGGRKYVISPWVLTWDDENYYLIGYDSEDEIKKHYRVDKMTDIKLTLKRREGKCQFEGFDMAGYAKQTFGMFSGKPTNVTIECSNYLIGAILDRFGTNNIIIPISDDKFQVQQQVNVSGQFYGWLVGLGPDARIIHPPHVVEEFKERIERTLANCE